jgi:hypothetical protein
MYGRARVPRPQELTGLASRPRLLSSRDEAIFTRIVVVARGRGVQSRSGITPSSLRRCGIAPAIDGSRAGRRACPLRSERGWGEFLRARGPSRVQRRALPPPRVRGSARGRRVTGRWNDAMSGRLARVFRPVDVRPEGLVPFGRHWLRRGGLARAAVSPANRVPATACPRSLLGLGRWGAARNAAMSQSPPAPRRVVASLLARFDRHAIRRGAWAYLTGGFEAGC